MSISAMTDASAYSFEELRWASSGGLNHAPSKAVLEESRESQAVSEIYPGTEVKIRDSVSTPSRGWGNVRRGQTGVVSKIIGDTVFIDFPRQTNWQVSKVFRIRSFFSSANKNRYSSVCQAN